MYTTCRVGVLSSEISKHSKISPPPSLRSHLTSSPMGVLSGDYGTVIFAISGAVCMNYFTNHGSVQVLQMSVNMLTSRNMKHILVYHTN